MVDLRVPRLISSRVENFVQRFIGDKRDERRIGQSEVLCVPDRRSQKNPYIQALYQSVSSHGYHVVDSTAAGLWRRRSPIWHIHWPEQYLNIRSGGTALIRTAYLLGCFASAKLRGCKLVWTAHNLQSHEQYHPQLERLFWRLFTSLVDGTIHLSRATEEAAHRCFPRLNGKASCVIPHGHYRHAYGHRMSKRAARELLGWREDTRVLLCLGQIRRYKNLGQLIRIVGQINDDRVRLVIAGACSDSTLREELAVQASSDPRVQIAFEFVPDESIHMYVSAADLMCLPYEHPVNSGVAMLAISLGLPCVMAATPNTLELQQRVGDAWLRIYRGALTYTFLSDALRSAEDSPRDATVDLSWCDWNLIGAETVAFYRKVTSGAADERWDRRLKAVPRE